MKNFSAMPYHEMIKNDIVWVGTPADVIERIEAAQKMCASLTEVAITVNPGDVEDTHAIYLGHGGPLPARVRVFVDFLAQTIRQPRWRLVERTAGAWEVEDPDLAAR